MIAHNRDLANRAVAILVQAWGTEELEVPTHMRAPFLRLVRLPLDDLTPEVARGGAFTLNDTLRRRFNIQVHHR